MKITIYHGMHGPFGQNERFILPSLSYISTYYLRNVKGHHAVVLFRGIVIQWWKAYLSIRFEGGKNV